LLSLAAGARGSLLFIVAVALCFPSRAHAQYPNALGWCEDGAQNVVTSGLTSTTQVQASYPQCTVSVAVHGGGTATIYSNDSGTALSNPFTASSNGQWQFFAAIGSYDIVLSGAGFPSPVTLSEVNVGIGGGGGGGSVIGCGTSGGIGYQNGTANILTCGANIVFNPSTQSFTVTGAGGQYIYTGLSSGNQCAGIAGGLLLAAFINVCQGVTYPVQTSGNVQFNPSGILGGAWNYNAATGATCWLGSTSGSACIQAAAVAGTPCIIAPPTGNPTAGQFLSAAAPSGSPATCQTNWGTPTGSGTVTTTGSPSQYQLSAFSGASSITGIGPGVAGYPFISGGAGVYGSFTPLTSAGLNITSTTCTNQFIRNIVSNGQGICSTIALADTPLTTNQDILFDSFGALSRLPIVTANYCLGNTSGAWASIVCGGSTTNQVKYGISANASGTATAVDSVVCTPPSVNGQYTVGYNPTASVAVAATCPLVGLAPRGVSGATDTILYSDVNNITIYTDNSGTALAGPTPTSLGNANAYTIEKNHSTGVVTFTPTTWTVSLSGGAAGATATIQPQQTCSLFIDPVTSMQWDLDCADAAGYVNGVKVTTAFTAGAGTFTSTAITDPGGFGSNETFTSTGCETSDGITTLATGATTTTTGVSCLPANSFIDRVVARVTTTITGSCTGWELGDGTTAARFSSNNTTLTTSGVTDAAHIGTFNNTGIASATTGMWQASAAAIVITCAGGDPTAGKIRVIVYSHTTTPPAS
jgi:hypothetical protein